MQLSKNGFRLTQWVSRLLFAAVIYPDGLLLNPLLTYAKGATNVLSQSAGLRARGGAAAGDFRIFVDGFTERDFSGPAAEAKRTFSTSLLNEAWIESNSEKWKVRAGRQNVRWSEQWAQPSLDVWTGRRWNRLFLDDDDLQFQHPVGVLLKYSEETWTAEIFQSFSQAFSQAPQPYAEKKERWNTEWGARASHGVFEEWSATGLFAIRETGGVSGFQLERIAGAFRPFVEAGWMSSISRFYTLGFLWTTADNNEGDGNGWAVKPSFINSHQPENWKNVTQNIGSIEGKWSSGLTSISIRGLYDSNTKDRFFSLNAGYRLSGSWTSSLFFQNYGGEGDRLFQTFQEITGGSVSGLRLQGEI